MINFLLNDLNLVFTIALTIVAGLALLEGLAVIIGASLMNILDDLIDIEISTEPNVSQGGLTSLLGWLCLNQLPMLVWLTLMLTGFAISGLTYNYILSAYFQVEFLYWFSKPIALLGSLYFTHFLGGFTAKIIPKNESSAVSKNDFVGKVATITIGNASVGNAAEAVLKDEYNQKHYVMVEPDNAQQTFSQGTPVVLVSKTETCWLAVEFNS